jgi:glycosyltransferase involved in cell wall biosynthesis
VLTTLPGRDQSLDGWVTETFAALARMPVDGPEPVVWPFTPYYTGNPFQAVLYGGFLEYGLVAAPTFRAEDLRAALRDWPADVPLVVHVHWLNQVLAKARTVAEAEAATDRHAGLLDELGRRGARLVWTVHNALPHDTRFEEQEVRLRREVVERADLVHVMSPRTPELVADWFALPADRIYQCDHPGYQGVYPDWVTRTAARRRLRIDGDPTVLLLAGALKPYKGLLDVLDAVERVDEKRPGEVVLVVAGKPDDAAQTARFLARATASPAVRLLPATIPDADVQVLMRACDVVALPYRRSLNSGVLALALTFGRPVLLPATSGSLAVVSGPDVAGAAVVYEPDGPNDSDSLTEAVLTCLDLDRAAAGAAAARAGARIDRATVARRFAADMRAWVDAEADS